MLLRDYQKKTIDEIRSAYASGVKRIILQAPTGSGKTVIYCYILKSLLEKGKRGIVIIHGRSLIAQTSKRLEKEGIAHSVLMSGYKSELNGNICLASIDTIYRRKILVPADICIIDEVHMASHKSESYRWVVENYPNSYFLGTTATPWVSGGLKHLADKIIYPISMAELVNQGHLVPLKYFVPKEFDSSKIKIKNGEFDDESALVQFEKQSVYGDVVKSFRTKCFGEPTFCFAINIAHAKLLDENFKLNGINSVIITADTSLSERERLLRALEKLEIECIVSVGTMTTGIDIPPLKNAILCRPTQSKNLYIQMLGRLTRTCPGKEFAKCIDLVGNVTRHGFLIDEQMASLEPMSKNKKGKTSAKPPIKTCPICFAVLKIHEKECVECGHVFAVEKKLPKEFDGELTEVNLDINSRLKIRVKFFLYNAWANGHNPKSIWWKLKEEFSDEDLRTYWRPYRAAKEEWEKWLDGRTPAPCAFGAFKTGFESTD